MSAVVATEASALAGRSLSDWVLMPSSGWRPWSASAASCRSVSAQCDRISALVMGVTSRVVDHCSEWTRRSGTPRGSASRAAQWAATRLSSEPSRPTAMNPFMMPSSGFSDRGRHSVGGLDGQDPCDQPQAPGQEASSRAETMTGWRALGSMMVSSQVSTVSSKA